MPHTLSLLFDRAHLDTQGQSSPARAALERLMRLVPCKQLAGRAAPTDVRLGDAEGGKYCLEITADSAEVIGPLRARLRAMTAASDVQQPGAFVFSHEQARIKP